MKLRSFLSIAIVLSFGFTACDRERPYDVDSSLTCTASIGSTAYNASMYGTRPTKYDCKGFGACWGEELPYESKNLGSLRCYQTAPYQQTKTFENIDEQTCQNEDLIIRVNKEAASATIEQNGVLIPMNCKGHTEFRDNSG